MRRLPTRTITRLCRERTLLYIKRKAPVWREQVAEHLPRITQRVSENYASGRINRRLGFKPERVISRTACTRYIDSVIASYDQSHELIAHLVRSESEAWEALQARLRRSAQSYLRNRLADTDQAEDFAQQACANIYHSTYPCDVSLEIWTKAVLLNVIRQAWRKCDALNVPSYALVSLDDIVNGENNSTDSVPRYERLTHDPFYADAIGLKLENERRVRRFWEIVPKLRSGQQREVICAYYNEGLTAKQVACKLNLDVKYVHLLRHRALKTLVKLARAQSDGLTDE